jgi:hypothetical protein
MGEVDGSGRGLQWRGVDDGVDVNVGGGCGADKANSPRTKRGGSDRNVGGGREFQTRGGVEATHGAGYLVIVKDLKAIYHILFVIFSFFQPSPHLSDVAIGPSTFRPPE